MIETHNELEAALSNHERALMFDKFEAFVTQMRAVAAAICKSV